MTEITTAEELDALPDGTRVRDRDGDVWEHWGGEWHTRETRPFDSAWLFRKWAPLTVLPDTPAPAAEDREALTFEHTPEAAAFGAAIEQAAHDSGVGWDEVHPIELACRLMAAGYFPAARQPAPSAEDRERCGVCDRDGGQHWYDHFPAARQPAPSFTPAQRHAAEQDPALFRVATRAQFGTGEVIDIVLRALRVPMVSAETTCRCAMYRSILREYGVDPDGLTHGRDEDQ